jgi:hypothetical protein
MTGRWRLTATEGGFDYETVITLEADAPERDFVQADQADPRFEPEREIRVDDARRMAPPRKASRVSQSAPATGLDHLLEAICTAPPRGWTEAELVPLVQAGLSDPRMVWDKVRSLAEAGWIDPYVSTSWRARAWRLRRPSLVEISTDCVLVDGAVGARSRRRLMSAVTVCGGELEVRDGVSQFAPPTMVVYGVSCGALAAECGWPSSVSTRPDLRSAPDCWTADLRTIEGRSLAGTWSFALGSFQTIPPGGTRVDGVAIERWRRERGEDRDVYRVHAAGPELILSSRTAAILEGYRRARRGLFRWTDGRLWRSVGSGYLPLPVARALRCKSLVAAGPMPSHDNVTSYTYGAEYVDAQWIASIFGAAIEIPKAPEAPPWMQPIIRARRMGLRPAPAELLMKMPGYRDRT